MVASTRRLTGAGLALVGAVAAVWSAFIGWYNGRKGTDIRVQDLFGSITSNHANTFASMFLPLGVAALLTLAGIALQSRWLWALAGLISIATPALWALRQSQTFLGLHADLTGRGPGLAAAGGVLMLVAAAVATGPARHAVPRRQRVAEPVMAAEPVVTPEQPAMRDEWEQSSQSYQQGYAHGMEQADEKTVETETLGRRRSSSDDT